MSRLAEVVRCPDRCDESVVRRGWNEPCDRPAVAVRLDPDTNDPYPVCPTHCRTEMVPLRELLFAVVEVPR